MNLRTLHRFALISFGVISFSFFTLAFAQNTNIATPDSGTVLAEVDGTKLTLESYEQKHPASLFNARNAYYDAHRKVAQQFVDDYLLERQAKKEGVTVEQLLQRHVNSTIAKDPSDEVLRVYYEGVETTEPFETVRAQIIEALRERRLARAKKVYMQSLRSEAKIAINIGPPRAHLNLNNVPVLGAATAPVMLVEYADYECPYCIQMKPTVDKLLSEYKGKLAFAYKDVPLPMHANAQKAAEASHCAEVQGKYWEYHDLLFSSSQLALPQLKEHARKLNLNGAAFDKCLDSGEQAQKVKAQSTEGQDLALQGTPSFFINGRAIGGSQSYDSIRKIVEEELAAASATSTVRAQR